MSTKHFIDKLLEEPSRSQNQDEKFARERVTLHSDEMSKDDMSEYHRGENCAMHVPREYRRPIYYNQYLPHNSICHLRPNRCMCQVCTTDAPPWLTDLPAPRFIDTVTGYHAHTPQSHMAARWNIARFTNSTLATKAKQQPCPSTAGGHKRKKRHRTAFTPTQLLGLENAFEQNQYSVGEERKQLASFLGLSETQIKVWFQNRRTKWKRIRKEAEEMSTDDEEKGSEAENHRHEARYQEYQVYTQHHVGPRISTDELCECRTLWPKGLACNRADRY